MRDKSLDLILTLLEVSSATAHTFSLTAPDLKRPE